MRSATLTGHRQREYAKRMIDAAPEGWLVSIKAPTRTNDQNARLWAMLGDVSNAKPDGRQHTPDAWKALFMHALGHQSRFMQGLDGEIFPVGFSSSRLTVREMGALIDFIDQWGTERGVIWHERNRYEDAA
jgi:hypothetical protein